MEMVDIGRTNHLLSVMCGERQEILAVAVDDAGSVSVLVLHQDGTSTNVNMVFDSKAKRWSYETEPFDHIT